MLNKEDNFFEENKEKNTDSENLLEMINAFDKKIITDLNPGDKVTGTITRIGSDYAFVDIQAKNEAILKKSEITDDIKAGDSITAFIVEAKDEILLSLKMSSKSFDKQALFDALNNKIPVQGKVSAVSKDGLTVKVFGQRAFCPISQIDIKFTSDINSFLGKTLDFIISRVSENGRNIILSRIPLLEQDFEKRVLSLQEGIGKNKVYTGVITKIADFGIFISINDVEGLAHISELSWEHITKPEDIFTVGQEVKCIVLKIDFKKPVKHTKISLSLKQTQEDPWDKFKQQHSVGETVQGKVVRITNFGAFIELLPGVDGLLHVSEMSWVKRIHHPSDILEIGNSVNVTILSIDTSKKSISLTLKDLSSDPWNDIETNFPVGSEVTGIIEKKSRYGYFIRLAEGITGLLVFSNINAQDKDNFKDNDSINVSILSVDKENRRISLSFGTSSENQEKKIINEYSQSQKKQTSADTSTEFGSALLRALSKKK